MEISATDVTFSLLIIIIIHLTDKGTNINTNIQIFYILFFRKSVFLAFTPYTFRLPAESPRSNQNPEAACYIHPKEDTSM